MNGTGYGNAEKRFALKLTKIRPNLDKNIVFRKVERKLVSLEKWIDLEHASVSEQFLQQSTSYFAHSDKRSNLFLHINHHFSSQRVLTETVLRYQCEDEVTSEDPTLTKKSNFYCIGKLSLLQRLFRYKNYMTGIDYHFALKILSEDEICSLAWLSRRKKIFEKF